MLRVQKTSSTCFTFCVILLLHTFVIFSPNSNAATFYTWEGFEPDKLASMWLLQRIIDPQNEILILPKNERLTDAIPFDIPIARLRRYHSESTYESILRSYKVTDARAICIGKIIHQIEINTWNMDNTKGIQLIKSKIWEIIDSTEDESNILPLSYAYFDQLYSNCK